VSPEIKKDKNTRPDARNSDLSWITGQKTFPWSGGKERCNYTHIYIYTVYIYIYSIHIYIYSIYTVYIDTLYIDSTHI
jgi:hypothetical protein